MVKLVSLDRVKSALRVDGDDLNADLELMIGAASEVLIGYAKNPDWLDVVPLVVPERFQIAAIALVGAYLREIDGDEQRGFGQNNLPWFVTATRSADVEASGPARILRPDGLG